MTQPLQPTPPWTPPPPPPTNGLGIAGFIVSLLGICTAGLLSPIGLLLSFFALFRRPRGFAFAGFLLGLVGTLFIVGVLTLFGWGAIQAAKYGKPMIVTFTQAESVRHKINNYALANGRVPPDDFKGQSLLAGEKDGWGRPLVYRKVNDLSFEIRSAGQDGTMHTEDDFSEIYDVGTSR